MKKLIPITLAAVSLVTLTGCMGLASTVEQLKNDPASVHLQVSTIYGQITLDRAFPTNWSGPAVIVGTNGVPATFAPLVPR